VVYTGTLTAKKGILSLVSAWTTVRRSCPEAELHIYGKDGREPGGGSMHAYLSTQLSDDVRDSVYFHGHVDRDHLLDVLSESRVAVFPSYSETFGIAPVEAMACGCATIYTRLSCGPEIVREGVDGLLVDPDRPDEIAGAIIRLLCDDKLAQRLGEAGRMRSRSCFSIDSVLGHNVEFYKACLGEFERRRRG
jgi:glycosyltransferase involved in cell wall biosynthesis